MKINHIATDLKNQQATVTYDDSKELTFQYSSGDVFAQATAAIKAVEPEAEFEDVPSLDVTKVGKLTKAQRISQLEQDYSKARFELGTYYMEAVLDGNVEVQKDLQTEMADVKAEYEEAVTAIMNEEE